MSPTTPQIPLMLSTARLDEWAIKERDYRIKEIHIGSYVYVNKYYEDDDPPLWYCTNCFENKKLSIIQGNYFEQQINGQGVNHWQCLACKSELILPSDVTPSKK